MSNNDFNNNNSNTRYYNSPNHNPISSSYNNNPSNSYPPLNDSLQFYSNDSLHLYSNNSLQLNHISQLHNFTIEEVVIQHAYTAILINRSITPVWYFIGLIGNSLSIAVWLQKRLRRNSSSAVYFAALSISDIIFLLLHMLQELSDAWFINALGFPVLCEMYAVFFLAGQYLAPTFVFCFTIDRYIAICWPFKKSKYCTPRQALKVVLLVVLLSILLCAIQGYFWHYDSLNQACTLRDIFNSSNNLWTRWTAITEIIVFFIIPVFNLMANVRVIIEIYKISKSQEPPATIITRPRSSSQPHNNTEHPKQMMASLRSKQNPQLLKQSSSLLGKLEPPHETRSSSYVASSKPTFPASPRSSYCVGSTRNNHQHSTNTVATNVMLLSVSFYVIFTTLPPAIIYAVETKYPEGLLTNTSHSIISSDLIWSRYFTFMHVKAIIYEICISHYACNFFIFILTGRKFRNAALSTFSCRKWQPDADNYYGNSNNFNNNNNNFNNLSNTTADNNSPNDNDNKRKVSQLRILFHDSLRRS